MERNCLFFLSTWSRSSPPGFSVICVIPSLWTMVCLFVLFRMASVFSVHICFTACSCYLFGISTDFYRLNTLLFIRSWGKLSLSWNRPDILHTRGTDYPRMVSFVFGSSHTTNGRPFQNKLVPSSIYPDVSLERIFQ
jgi:hypothetical protein